MNRINFKGKDGGGFHHLTPYQKKSRKRNIFPIDELKVQKEKLHYYNDLTTEKLEEFLLGVFTPDRHTQSPGFLVEKPIAEVTQILNKIEVINEPTTYKHKNGFKMYHSHQTLKLGDCELSVTDSIGGCGMQQFYGWTNIKNKDIGIKLINYYLKIKSYGVGLVICQLGRDYFGGPFEQALITCGFTISNEYSNYQHDSRGSYKQRIYSLQTKYKYD